MFGGSSQLVTTAEHFFVVWTLLNDLITARSAVVLSWEESPNIWSTVAKQRICWLSSEFYSPHVIERHSKQNEWLGAPDFEAKKRNNIP